MTTVSTKFFSAKGATVTALAAAVLAFPFSAQASTPSDFSAQAPAVQAPNAQVPTTKSAAAPEALTLPGTDVQRAQARGILTGDAQGSLAVNRGLTRAEFAVLVARSFGLDTTSKPSASSFKDLKTSSWASSAAEALLAKGWMTGSGSAFLPDAPVTQEQMAVVLAKALDLSATPVRIPGLGLAESDLAAASSWAAPALRESAAAGLLGVYAQGVKPGQQVLRGEAASAVLAASNLQPQTIEAVQNGIVKLGGVAYAAAPELSGLFSAANAPALAGASAKLTIANGIVTQVRGLELNAAGRAADAGKPEFSGNLTLDGAGVKVHGAVTVNGDYFTLNKLEIGGDFTIGTQVKHDFSSTGLIVTGVTNIRGGDDNTVVFQSARLGQVVLDKTNVRMAALEGTKMAEINVRQNASIDGDESVTIPSIKIEKTASAVNLNATVDIFAVHENAMLSMGPRASIRDILIPQLAKLSDFVKDWSRVSDKFRLINGFEAFVPAALPSAPQPSAGRTTPAVTPPVVTPPVTPPVITPPVVTPVDPKASLKAAAADAGLALKEASVGEQVGADYPKLNHDALSLLLAQAQTALESDTLTQTQLNQAADKLANETKTLRASKNYTGLTRKLAIARAASSTLEIGTQPRQVSQAVYESFYEGLSGLENQNPDPFVIEGDKEQQLTQSLVKLQQVLEGNRFAWRFEELSAAIQAAEKALKDHSDGTGGIGLIVAIEEAKKYAAVQLPALQQKVDELSRNLVTLTETYLKSSPPPTLPPVILPPMLPNIPGFPFPGFPFPGTIPGTFPLPGTILPPVTQSALPSANPEQLTYNPETDTLESAKSAE
ncbi:S-layer homology domain-containing protein [Saccharibacillus brassicae]|uniref:SLH domain-containing protein n=1 Tax=Saccharibacillus brassicae TaxID=2583377 RepID=A0A4Y6UTJ7_SACBS|nr:S-layer homology domain-containing protein [Saccharibacillus brassicae]QDH19696.1 hypothetical protein FFV09_01740 [Saccharibacillus brassicae]